jgi:hypothetical protein
VASEATDPEELARTVRAVDERAGLHVEFFEVGAMNDIVAKDAIQNEEDRRCIS